jgi:protein-L-isoaspartate(D-aspartate) O-methyltransferase
MNREHMVNRQVQRRGIRDSRVLAAMGTVPRNEFVPADLVPHAYADSPLTIGAGQTISQPYIVALMVDALGLSAEDRVLEIGTGSGYGAAVLSKLAAHVDTVERHAALAGEAQVLLARLGYTNIDVHIGDGTLGWPEGSPYDAICVTAAGPDVPQALLDQLAQGGRLVIPVGGRDVQDLVRMTLLPTGDWRRENLGPVRFVPLIGEDGWVH